MGWKQIDQESGNGIELSGDGESNDELSNEGYGQIHRLLQSPSIRYYGSYKDDKKWGCRNSSRWGYIDQHFTAKVG